ncbi:protein Daple-like [Hydractinia symbiolongicarpus]|uniref:protein Daple-like n=1 Tax=Hydractinia symbiolongicarpus TaxID=13093 RepID=UPI00254E5D91|nr:protein Daple-like [Hydractinia symbiolongicarpus]
MRCEFCNEVFENTDLLQEHQALTCPAVHDGQRREEPENATVKFKWLVDRVVEPISIYLICSDMVDNIELKKSNASYISDFILMNTGKYNGQLVINNELIPIVPFEIDFLSEMVFLIAERVDSTVEDITPLTSPRQNIENSPRAEMSPRVERSPSEKTPRRRETPPRGEATPERFTSPRDHRGPFEEESHLSPLHQELLNHQVRHSDANFEDLQTSTDRSAQETSTPRLNGQNRQSNDAASPRNDEDHTLMHVDDLGNDRLMLGEHAAREHQQPVESEAEDVITPPRGRAHQLLNNSNSSSEFSPRERNADRDPSVADMLLELSTTYQEGEISRQTSNPIETEEFDHLQDLVPLHSEPSFQTTTANEALEDALQDAMRETPAGEENEENVRRGGELSDALQDTGDDNAAANNVEESGEGYVSDSSSSLMTPVHVLTNDEVAQARALNRENSREGSTRRRSARSRNLSLSNQRSQDRAGDEESDLSELRAKCDSLESEIERLQKEEKRLKELMENYKEVKQELETKCCSYDEEMERLKKSLRDQEEKNNQELSKFSQLNANVEAERDNALRNFRHVEGELHTLNQKYEELLAKKDQGQVRELKRENESKNDQIVELYAKCESFEMEVVRLKNENVLLKKRKQDEGSPRISDMKLKFQELDRENKRLLSECQSFEAAQKLHEEDVNKERELLEKRIKTLEIENTDLRIKTSSERVLSNHFTDFHDSTSKKNIEKLKKENHALKEKLQNIRHETEVTASLQNGEISRSRSEENRHEPHILSPRHSASKSRNSETYSYRHLPSTPILPNRRDCTRHSNDVEYDGDEKVGDYNSSYYLRSSRHSNPYPALDDTSPSDYGMSHISDAVDVARRHNRTDYAWDNIHVNDILRDHATPSSQKKSHLQRTRSLKDGVDAIDFSVNRPLENSRFENSRYHPKSRSLDLGLEDVGYKEESSYTRRKYDSLTSVPFCPTTSRDLRVGMKVSVNRACGKLSRGIVKWIGTLPYRSGDYIGIELESESGRHNGYFEGVQYFKCKPYRGVFVKFPKVIMAWK